MNKQTKIISGFIFGIACIFILITVKTNISIEGFTSNTNKNTNIWSQDILKKFKEYQNTTFNNSYQFNMDKLQQQASSKDVEYLMNNDKWPWSTDTQNLYLAAIGKSTMVQILPKESLDNVMKIYNENAMRQLLSWNTKEGDFLLGGVKVGEGKKQKSQNEENNFTQALYPDKAIKCDGDKGMIWSSNNKKINNADLPSLISGFEFGDAGVCNPCIALEDNANYSCPFSLNINGDKSVSSIWKDFWS